MKKILGLDLGTNSIGWALVEIDHENGIVKILGLGSRIIPMNAGEIKDFESNGKIKSAAAQRTETRGPRRLNERYLLRRDRLHLVLNLLDALPKHYKLEIDFTNEKGEKSGKLKANKEPKLAYLPKRKGEKAEFLFKDSYQEMLDELKIENRKGNRIPYDWTLYYLRDKALKSKEMLKKENKEPLTLEELAWVLLSYNQKRGYEKNEVEDKATKQNEIIEEFDLQVKSVTPKVDIKGSSLFEIQLEGNDAFVYNEKSSVQLTQVGDIKEVIKISQVDEQGNVEKTHFKIIDIYSLEISALDYKKEDGKHKYTLTYKNGWEEQKRTNNYTFKYKNALKKIYDYIVETEYDTQGNLKLVQGKERKLREPDFNDTSNDWTLLKKKTEKETLAFNIDNGFKKDNGDARKFISPKIYNTLKCDAKTGLRTKIIGGVFQVVDRDFYREELNQIIATQKDFHTSLEDEKIFGQCVRTLYPKNQNHQKSLLNNKDAIQNLLVEDILLYQRPLKSKKSEIANCKYEVRYWDEVLDKKTKKAIEEVDEETGEVTIKQQPIYHKVVSASHPYFQEFRIWDKLHNIRLIQLEKVDKDTGEIQTNLDVTKGYFKTDVDYQNLFNKLNNQKSLSQNQFLKYCKDTFGIPYIKKEKNFVWNFPEDEELKGNETRVSFVTRFKRCGYTEYKDYLTQEKEIDLWHYLYSVSYKERTANNNKSVTTFFNRFFEGSDVTEEVKNKIIQDFVNYPKFPSRYCAYSEKALKKLMPFIRMGKNRFAGKFDVSEYLTDLQSIEFDSKRIRQLLKKSTLNGKEKEAYKQSLYDALWKHSVNERIEEILIRLKKIDFTAEKVDYSQVTRNKTNYGELPYPKGLFNAFKNFNKVDDFTSLDLTKTSYLVYGRHSELAQAKYWTSPDKVRNELRQELKQHSLNNPVAEKVLLEMMQIVAAIWEYYGEKNKNTEDYEKLFDKIHLEVGRELKKSVKEKEADSKRQSGNRAQNKRLRQVLEEFLTRKPYNANPINTDHFERLKILEEGAEHTKNNDKEFFKGKSYTKKDIEDILKKQSISKTDFEKYKLWIEQGYRSPYTNQVIKLTDLFDGAKYNIDHVFPQASITNNSLSNKVVCELEVNTTKSDQTGREFVNNPKQRNVPCEAHKTIKNPKGVVEIVNDETYVSIIKAQFSGNKKLILLSKEIPKGFTNSQLNNSRHIARKAMELLSHIVREPGEVEFRSKNVLPVTGAVTGKLKEAWKLDQVWKELVAPRYIRMNELTQSKLFGSWQKSKAGHDYFDCNLDKSIREKDDSYNIKRIDHRHHALDALIVALCTEDHVNYLSNINANKKLEKYGEQRKLEAYRKKLKRKIMFSKPKKDKPKENDWYYLKPGEARQKNAENSREDSVLTKSYFYKDLDSFNKDYKKMILTALQHTIVTFKQNLRVINKTVNLYNNSPDKKKKDRQEGEKGGNKENWAIRRSLGKGTYYGKIDIGDRINKQLLKNAKFFYENIDAIVDMDLRFQLQDIKTNSISVKDFEVKLKENFKNTFVECIAFKAASRFNSELNESFNREKIGTITDKGIQKILTNHLKQFDTTELPFEEALKYFDSILEKHELEAILKEDENLFKGIEDLTDFLRLNDFKYKKVNFSKLHLFIEHVPDEDFRNDERFKDKIGDHPEIAFTPEMITKMNEAENLIRLNEGKNHKPIFKMRTYSGFGNEKSVSDNKSSVKHKQFVKVDKGTNFYLAIYEIKDKSKISRENPIRIFKEISLFDLIEFQKSTNNFELPIEENVHSVGGEKYSFLFTLTQNDVVKINLKNDELIYAFNRYSGNDVYFRPINHSTEVEKYEVDRKINSLTGKLSGSQVNETTSINGAQIKNICLKLKVDRLGNILMP